jgi:hypothetical protein
MKFLVLIKVDESVSEAPPQALFDAMDKLIAEQTKSGLLLETAGLTPTSQGARVRIKGKKLHVTDGPFAEATEVIGGYAMINAASREEAIQSAKDFLQLHIDHWPGFEAACEVRQVAEE